MDMMIREGSMDFDPTMNYLVVDPWELHCNKNRGAVNNVRKDAV